jgi:tetratricopeptide (TPR) repeat protein
MEVGSEYRIEVDSYLIPRQLQTYRYEPTLYPGHVARGAVLRPILYSAMNSVFSKLWRSICVSLAIWLIGQEWLFAQGNPPELRPADTNGELSVGAYLQLQEQLQATRLALERNRQEAEAAAARNSDALAGRLQSLEQTLAAQRSRELEIAQNSNRAMLTLAGALAAVGMIALLAMAYFQWQTVSRLAEISAGLPMARAPGGRRPFAALSAGDSALLTPGPVEQTNLRLHAALEQLEKRIGDLEHTTHRSWNDEAPDELTAAATNARRLATTPREGNHAPDAARIKVLLGKGQSLMNLDQAGEALRSFEEALSIEPAHPEALMKKGSALEQLGKLDEALACYDQVLAADRSLTLAYIAKGGLFNRMQRFKEALECYEQALATREKRAR